VGAIPTSTARIEDKHRWFDLVMLYFIREFERIEATATCRAGCGLQ
jgi:hypothetical protein